jgi:hypothetical protein
VLIRRLSLALLDVFDDLDALNCNIQAMEEEIEKHDHKAV